MRGIKHISDLRQGIIVKKGIIISISLSLFLQLLFSDKVSLLASAIFVIYIY